MLLCADHKGEVLSLEDTLRDRADVCREILRLALRGLIGALEHGLAEIQRSVRFRTVGAVASATTLAVDRMRAQLSLEHRTAQAERHTLRSIALRCLRCHSVYVCSDLEFGCVVDDLFRHVAEATMDALRTLWDKQYKRRET